jgi:hypothetical protein
MELSPLKCNIKKYIYTYTCLFVLLLCALKLPRIRISLLISRAVSLLWHIRPCFPFSLLSSDTPRGVVALDISQHCGQKFGCFGRSGTVIDSNFASLSQTGT